MNRFGEYLLEKEIGRGGTATVYLAANATNQPVCLKVFHPSLLKEANARKRIEREYQVLCALKHPNLIRVHEVLLDGEAPALVMDYVPSETLERYQSRLPYTLPEVSVLIVIEVLRAIDYAHSKGIIHRDLKPENVLIGNAGGVFVSDFGLAKMTSSETAITQAKHIVGTVGFMSPEQSMGQALGAQSDLFSVGALLYFLVTGTKPFSKASAVETLAAIQKETPESPQKQNPKVSQELAAIISKALEKNTATRYRSASDFAVALSQYLASLGLTPEAFSFADWMEDPTGITMEALRLSTENLIKAGEAAIDQNSWSNLLLISAHVAAKAPHSPAIGRWSKMLGEYKKAQRKKAILRWSIALLLLLIPIGGVAWYFLQRPITVAQSDAKLGTNNSMPVANIKTPPTAMIAATTGEVKFKLGPAIKAYWDGALVQTSSLAGVTLGKHNLRLERKGFDPIQTEVVVAGDKPAIIQAE